MMMMEGEERTQKQQHADAKGGEKESDRGAATAAPTTQASGAEDGQGSSKKGSSANCVFIKKKRKGKGSRANVRKRSMAQAQLGAGADDDDDNDDRPLPEKREKPVRGGIGGSTARAKSKKEDALSVTYKSSRSTNFEGPRDMGATAVINIDTEHDRDAQAAFERARKSNEEESDSGVYRGMGGYRQLTQRKDTVGGSAYKGISSKGPVRAPLNIRSTVRWDYQPDICKDYKETGYCGFGDTCKFMHDRSDYKFGWQIDQEIERGEYGKMDVRQYEVQSDSDSEDELPFACFICRERFTHPVVTKCKHYFCEKCLLQAFKKSMNCPVCTEKTGGLFQPAKDIIEKQKQTQEENNDDSD